MIFLFSIIIQTIIVFFIAWVVHQTFWTIVNIVRLFLYYKLDKDTFTHQEKVNLKIIQEEPEVVVLDPDPETQSHDEFWDNFNLRYDLEYKKSDYNPDEILFKGRIKRRRK